MSFNSWDDPEQITSHEDAPRFYSRQAIFGFCILFSPLFGSVLLMRNLSQIGDSQGKKQVILFCLCYMVAVFAAVAYNGKADSQITFLLNILGGCWLLYYWWPKFISPELKYRRKPIWKALLISFLIVIPFALALLFQAGAL